MLVTPKRQRSYIPIDNDTVPSLRVFNLDNPCELQHYSNVCRGVKMLAHYFINVK